jgi:hypothetical protein
LLFNLDKLKVGTLRGYYRFKLSPHRKRRMVDSDYEQLENDLKAHPDTVWMQRQTLLTRKKRDYIVDSNAYVSPSDPFWQAAWYLSRNSFNSSLPDMNVTGAWRQGFTGRGVTVTFLDDGFERDHPDLEQNFVNIDIINKKIFVCCCYSFFFDCERINTQAMTSMIMTQIPCHATILQTKTSKLLLE